MAARAPHRPQDVCGSYAKRQSMSSCVWLDGTYDRHAGKRGRSARDGFTLIEVVLALTIFALMGGILYGVFSLGHTAVEKSRGEF